MKGKIRRKSVENFGTKYNKKSRKNPKNYREKLKVK